MDLNHRPKAYESSALPLSYAAIEAKFWFFLGGIPNFAVKLALFLSSNAVFLS